MSKEKEARFEKAAFGYRPEDVDRYIAESDKKLAAAKAEKAELLSKMKILADKITEYRSDEGNLKEAMLGAQRMKASIENEAKSKADTTVSEAQEYANQLIADAQAKSSQMVADAQERANKMIAEAQKTAEQKVNSVTSQVERERATLSQLQKEVSGFKNPADFPLPRAFKPDYQPPRTGKERQRAPRPGREGLSPPPRRKPMNPPETRLQRNSAK